METTPQSVRELIDFPYPTYDEFKDAYAQRLALVWVRTDVRTAWRLGDFGDRFGYFVMFGCAWFLAAVFAVFAAVFHNSWLLWGTHACLLTWLCATPTPGLISGGGCVPTLFLFGSIIAAVCLFHGVLILVGVCAYFSWFMACAGLGVADGAIREAMLRSEAIFIQLYQNGIITEVANKT